MLPAYTPSIIVPGMSSISSSAFLLKSSTYMSSKNPAYSKLNPTGSEIEAPPIAMSNDAAVSSALTQQISVVALINEINDL